MYNSHYTCVVCMLKVSLSFFFNKKNDTKERKKK